MSGTSQRSRNVADWSSSSTTFDRGTRFTLLDRSSSRGGRKCRPARCFRRGREIRRKKERARARRFFLPVSSFLRSSVRLDVGNHAPHSPSAAEIFGFIVCEGLSPNRESSPVLEVGKREAARRRTRKTSRKEGEKGPMPRTKKEEKER